MENDRFGFFSPLGDLGATYDVHLMLVGKGVVDFLLVLIERFFTRCYRVLEATVAYATLICTFYYYYYYYYYYYG